MKNGEYTMEATSRDKQGIRRLSTQCDMWRKIVPERLFGDQPVVCEQRGRLELDEVNTRRRLEEYYVRKKLKFELKLT